MRVPCVLALVLLGATACHGGGAAPDAAPRPRVSGAETEAARGPGDQPPAARPDAATAAELEALFRARRDSARLRFVPADVAFMTGMIHHHAQAVAMSRFAPPNDASPAIRTLAARIINAQRDEIALMQRWLRDRGQPVPEVHIDGARVMVHGGGDAHAHHQHMPGMLTDAQLEELAASRGPTFDRLFLTLMIAHHKGAVTMVRELFATDGAGQDADVFKFASDVQVDQSTEVARMERMLAALPASSGGR